MSKAPVEKPPRGWLTKQQMAEVLDVSEQHFDRTFRPMAADAAIKTIGKRLYFHCRKVLDAWCAGQIAKLRPEAPSADPLLEGPDSPVLDRLRLANAKMAELELAERTNAVVQLDLIRDAMRPALAAMRSAGDRLVRQFGNDAGEIFNEGVGEFEAAAARVLEQRYVAGVASDPTDQRGNADPPLRRIDANAAAAQPG